MQGSRLKGRSCAGLFRIQENGPLARDLPLDPENPGKVHFEGVGDLFGRKDPFPEKLPDVFLPTFL